MKQNIVLTIENAEKVSFDLSDLLCWWEGFKMGLKIGETDHFMVAENGIDAVRNLNIEIRNKLTELR